MSEPDTSSRSDTANPAVRQVLDAENAARESIEAAEHQARQRIEQARAEARAIEQRATERAGEIQRHERARAEQRIEALSRETRKRLDEVEQLPRGTAMEAACDRLVDDLTSPFQPTPPGPQEASE